MLKLLVRRLGIPYVRHGNRMMIALDDVERLRRDQVVRGVRASDDATRKACAGRRASQLARHRETRTCYKVS